MLEILACSRGGFIVSLTKMKVTMRLCLSEISGPCTRPTGRQCPSALQLRIAFFAASLSLLNKILLHDPVTAATLQGSKICLLSLGRSHR